MFSLVPSLFYTFRKNAKFCHYRSSQRMSGELIYISYPTLELDFYNFRKTVQNSWFQTFWRQHAFTRSGLLPTADFGISSCTWPAPRNLEFSSRSKEVDSRNNISYFAFNFNLEWTKCLFLTPLAHLSYVFICKQLKWASSRLN